MLDEIKWQLRLPTRFAMRELKLSYLERVQQETTAFLNDRIKHDFLRPDRELSLDLLIKEAEVLIAANEDVRALADSGELKRIHATFVEAKNRVETEYFAFREHLAKVLLVVEGKENEIYEKLIKEFGLANVRRHGDSSPILDTLGFATGDNAFDNLSLVDGAIAQGHESAEQLKAISGTLHGYLGVKAKIFSVDADLKEAYLAHVATGEDDVSLAREEFQALSAARDQYSAAFSARELSPAAQPEYEGFTRSLGELKETLGQQLVDDVFQAYGRAHQDRSRVYQGFTRGATTEILDQFRTDLLQHLAGTIVVKEHRERYQKEQFDRFVASLQYGQLNKRHQSLREFCREYANMIEILIEDSHNDHSPKIEANYDDFGEKTVRPFNATIFYYFFSADRRKRTVAQWLLSAIRYPNDRVRRAYMRFFA